MKGSEYQEHAHKTAVYPAEQALSYLGLGLASEAGEVAGKIKKLIRDGARLTPAEVEAMKSAIGPELGDVCWYIAELATHLGLDLDVVLQANVDKLHSRLKRDAIKGSGDDR